MKKLFKTIFVFVTAFLFTNKVKAVQVEINKVDENLNPISGVTIEIDYVDYDGKAQPVETNYIISNNTIKTDISQTTSTTDGSPIILDLPLGTILSITETNANGYKIIPDIMRLVVEENSIRCFDKCNHVISSNNQAFIINHPNVETASMFLRKTDENLENLSGTTLVMKATNDSGNDMLLDDITISNAIRIILSNDKKVITWKTTDNNSKINNLTEGTYYIYETEATEGYQKYQSEECLNSEKYSNECPIAKFTVKDGKITSVNSHELVTWDTSEELLSIKNLKISSQQPNQPDTQNQPEEQSIQQTQPTTTEKKIVENPKTLDGNNTTYIVLGIIALVGIIGLGTKFVKSK